MYYNDFYNEGVGFDSLREQAEQQGLTAEINVVYGKGVEVSGGVSPQPQNQGRKAGDWYVYQNGEYSFMTPAEFASVIKSSAGVYKAEQCNPVGIVAFDSADGGSTTIMALFDANSAQNTRWADDNHLDTNPSGTNAQYGWSTDFNGKTNTAAIKTAGGENFDTWYPAAFYADDFKAFRDDKVGVVDATEWYLPAIGEIHKLLGNMNTVITEMGKYKSLNVTIPTDGSSYWCSSELVDHKGIQAWLWDYSPGRADEQVSNKSNTYLVRPFAVVPGSVSSPKTSQGSHGIFSSVEELRLV